ncbi:hypothetical protein ACHAXT_005619 [Thalassiosira profunda]
MVRQGMSQGGLGSMDGRDGARMSALARRFGVEVFTVSQQNGTAYCDRHLDGNFNGRRLIRGMKRKWKDRPPRFLQVYLDYFWNPDGTWTGDHWRMAFVRDFLPSLVKEGLLDFGDLDDVKYDPELEAHVSAAGVVYLPFCERTLTLVVANEDELSKFFTIYFVHKNKLKEHMLWDATNASISPAMMSDTFEKEINQEERYCTLDAKKIRNGHGEPSVRKEKVEGVRRRIDCPDSVRMIKLMALLKWDPNCPKSRWEGKDELGLDIGGYVGIAPETRKRRRPQREVAGPDEEGPRRKRAKKAPTAVQNRRAQRAAKEASVAASEASEDDGSEYTPTQREAKATKPSLRPTCRSSSPARKGTRNKAATAEPARSPKAPRRRKKATGAKEDDGRGVKRADAPLTQAVAPAAKGARRSRRLQQTKDGVCPTVDRDAPADEDSEREFTADAFMAETEAEETVASSPAKKKGGQGSKAPVAKASEGERKEAAASRRKGKAGSAKKAPVVVRKKPASNFELFVVPTAARCAAEEVSTAASEAEASKANKPRKTQAGQKKKAASVKERAKAGAIEDDASALEEQIAAEVSASERKARSSKAGAGKQEMSGAADAPKGRDASTKTPEVVEDTSHRTRSSRAKEATAAKIDGAQGENEGRKACQGSSRGRGKSAKALEVEDVAAEIAEEKSAGKEDSLNAVDAMMGVEGETADEVLANAPEEDDDVAMVEDAPAVENFMAEDEESSTTVLEKTVLPAVSHGESDRVADEEPDRIADEEPHGVSHGESDRVADEEPDRIADEEPHGVSHEESNRVADEEPDDSDGTGDSGAKQATDTPEEVNARARRNNMLVKRGYPKCYGKQGKADKLDMRQQAGYGENDNTVSNFGEYYEEQVEFEVPFSLDPNKYGPGGDNGWFVAGAEEREESNDEQSHGHRSADEPKSGTDDESEVLSKGANRAKKRRRTEKARAAEESMEGRGVNMEEDIEFGEVGAKDSGKSNRDDASIDTTNELDNMAGSGGEVYSPRPEIPDHERESFTEAQQTGAINCSSIMDLISYPCSNTMWVDKAEYVKWKKDKMSSPRPTGPKERPQSQDLEEVAAGGEPVTSFSQNDVLSGRGFVIRSHTGNERYRSIANDRKAEYLLARKGREKTQIAAQVVQAVRRSNPPGRFLKESPQGGVFYEIGDEAAIRKTKQALREKTRVVSVDRTAALQQQEERPRESQEQQQLAEERPRKSPQQQQLAEERPRESPQQQQLVEERLRELQQQQQQQQQQQHQSCRAYPTVRIFKY